MSTRSVPGLWFVRRNRQGDLSSRSSRSRALGFEALEVRSLLSVVPVLPTYLQAKPAYKIHPLAAFDANGSTSPYGLTPNQVRGAYGLGTYTAGVLSNGVSFGEINGDGSGQTIAIVDMYDDPNALSDVNAFSAYYGLPQFGGAGGPTFKKVNQSGQASPLPGTDPSGPSTSDWELEESLDIEWAHVMAPMANIVLFEASSNLFAAVQAADNTSGVVAISMSWSQNENSGSRSSQTMTIPLTSQPLPGMSAVRHPWVAPVSPAA